MSCKTRTNKATQKGLWLLWSWCLRRVMCLRQCPSIISLQPRCAPCLHMWNKMDYTQWIWVHLISQRKTMRKWGRVWMMRRWLMWLLQILQKRRKLSMWHSLADAWILWCLVNGTHCALVAASITSSSKRMGQWLQEHSLTSYPTPRTITALYVIWSVSVLIIKSNSNS